MLEDYLIDCCSPTLASLKSGSLFNCRYIRGSEDIKQCINDWNANFEGTGIRMYLLRETGSSALIYVFRESALSRTLKDPEIRDFLRSYGYDSCCGCCGCGRCGHDVDECLSHLRDRITSISRDGSMRFPHEIGVFLDYPLQDVKGFICNNGRNCKYTGMWKVYSDELKARKTFARYEKCRDVYSRLWKSGRRSILQLTVAG